MIYNQIISSADEREIVMDDDVHLIEEYRNLERAIRSYRRAVFSAVRNGFITKQEALDKMRLKFEGKLKDFNHDLIKATSDDGWFTPVECSLKIYRLHKMANIDFLREMR